jgi:hypothetical protein
MASSEAAGDTTWAYESIRKECEYIVDCSFTEDAQNHAEVERADDAYGAINDNRIFERGPDWVRPGEAAVGAIGLMSGAKMLHLVGEDVDAYERVLDGFFRTWILGRQQPVDAEPASPDRGGFFARVHYTADGRWQSSEPTSTAVTGQMLVAMWKYYEYLRDTGHVAEAADWLDAAWGTADRGGRFISRMMSDTWNLVRSNDSRLNLWTSDSAYAAAGLRCLSRWALETANPGAATYAQLVDRLASGMTAMKHRGTTPNFYRYRDASEGYAPTYGDSIDQLCFLPYGIDVLDPGEGFCREISDWWTFGSSDGSNTVQMTSHPTDAGAWQHFGVHWHFYFDQRPENVRLYPGPGLELAKAEWKHACATGDPTLLTRAGSRLEWVVERSELWFGHTGESEAGVPNGIVDWRNENAFPDRAEPWFRFVDTSAYFIEAVLMIHCGIGPTYTPDDGLHSRSLRLLFNDGHLVLTWSGYGKLEHTEDLVTPAWQVISDAVNPYITRLTGDQAFFRLTDLP